MPSQSSAGHLARCLAWAEASGRLHAAYQFDGRQVGLDVEEWMKACGWEPWSPNTGSAVVAQQTWRRGGFVATDVAPRNAIITEADNKLRAIDFVVTRLTDDQR